MRQRLLHKSFVSLLKRYQLCDQYAHCETRDAQNVLGRPQALPSGTSRSVDSKTTIWQEGLDAPIPIEDHLLRLIQIHLLHPACIEISSCLVLADMTTRVGTPLSTL